MSKQTQRNDNFIFNDLRKINGSKYVDINLKEEKKRWKELRRKKIKNLFEENMNSYETFEIIKRRFHQYKEGIEVKKRKKKKKEKRRRRKKKKRRREKKKRGRRKEKKRRREKNKRRRRKKKKRRGRKKEKRRRK